MFFILTWAIVAVSSAQNVGLIELVYNNSFITMTKKFLWHLHWSISFAGLEFLICLFTLSFLICLFITQHYNICWHLPTMPFCILGRPRRLVITEKSRWAQIWHKQTEATFRNCGRTLQSSRTFCCKPESHLSSKKEDHLHWSLVIQRAGLGGPAGLFLCSNGYSNGKQLYSSMSSIVSIGLTLWGRG